MRKHISRQLIAGFTGIVAVAVLLIGTIFIGLYQRAAIETKQNDMLLRARNLAPMMAVYMEGTGMPRGMGGIFRMMDVMADAHLWVVDADGVPLSLPGSGGMGMMGGNAGSTWQDSSNAGGLTLPDTSVAENGTLPANAAATIREILTGREATNETFSDLYGEATLTVGVPILSSSGTIIGGVLLHAAVDGVTTGVGRVYGVLGLGLLMGLLAASALGATFSVRFTRPLQRMNRLAHAMADGDYQVRTGMARQDEIGQLGDALDHLAASLQTAAMESDRLEQMRRDFVANVSHEFRTPLTVIRGSAEALRDGAAEQPEERRHRLEAILSETSGMNRLVGDLLELSRLESGSIRFEPEPVWVGELLDDIWRSLSPMAMNLHVSLKRELQDALPPVLADYGRLRQLVLIFLDNALKHAPAGSSVTVSAHLHSASGNHESPTGRPVEQDLLEMRIRDEGPGIPADELPLVWERFHTVSKARNRQGTGLGLPIARQLGERMGVRLSLESHPGEGTAAVLTLPLAPMPKT